MTHIALMLILFFAVLAGLMLLFNWLTHVFVRTMIGKRHRAIEIIHETGNRPEGWSEAELNRLRKYVRKTRLVENEEVRVQLLQELDQLRCR